MMGKRSLRTQLLWSHLALVGLMGLVMIGAVFNFLSLGRSIDRILSDNYKSVVAAQHMKEALDHIDNAAALYLAGDKVRAQQQYRENVDQFEAAYLVQVHNITEPHEREMTEGIHSGFASYKLAVERLLTGKPGVSGAAAHAYYYHVLQPRKDGAPGNRGMRALVQDVLDLNQAAMMSRDARARAQAGRASVLSIGVTLAALVFAVIFAHRVINAALTPLLALAQGADEIGAGHLNRRIELNRSDEIGSLAQAFNQMAEKLREARRIEERRLHRAQKVSDAALESLYDPVLVTDPTGTVVYLNRAAEGLFGPSERAAGLLVGQVVREERIAAAIERAVRQARVSADEGEEALVRLDYGGSERVYRLRATPMRDDDDELLGAALVLEDVTHLRELDRLKSEFIGVASHELRTPVTSLLLSAQLLQEEAAGPLTPAQHEVVAAQRQDLERLDRLMGDLLDVTKLEAGVTPPRLEVVRPADLLQAACASVASQAAASEVRLECDVAPDLPDLRVDPGQMSRVLVNLLNNAVRHTPRGGCVTVAAVREKHLVRLRVTDTGAGIPSQYLPHIFERFVQVPGATRGGAGLGLSLAQSIAKLHRSEITARSEPGKGTTFEFSLPAAEDGA